MRNITITILILLLATTVNTFSQSTVTKVTTLMGSRFEITIVATDSTKATQHIDTIIAEISRIENLISDWRYNTQVSEVNRQAGSAPVKVDKEVLALTQRAVHVSEITKGAFDISFAAMEKVWKFDGSMTRMPQPEVVQNAKRNINYKNIIIDTTNTTIFLKEKGMKIGFGALGEGYAADRCKNIMQEKGVKSGMINASGDIITWGLQTDGTPWVIGITNPFAPASVFAAIPMKKSAITTSGSYEKYAILDGKRYSHIIDPQTGYPTRGLVSVTIMGPSAEFANALSTSIMVLGQKKGLSLLKKHKEYSGLLITDNRKAITSKRFRIKKHQITPL